MSSLTPTVNKFPVMQDGNIDYVDGNSYTVKSISLNPSNDGARLIRHKLSGSNLIRKLIYDEAATFACVVSAPWCAYRSLRINSKTFSDDQHEMIVEQAIDSESTHYASPSMFQPLIIASKDLSGIKLSEEDGVNGLWVGDKIDIPKGAKIAYGPYFHAASLTQSILKIQVSNFLPKGCFEVNEVPEQGFYFQVNASPDLFEKLKNPGKSVKHRDSIYCFALSQALEILKEKYEDEDKWRDHINLRHLYKFLKNMGTSTWDQEGFSPNQAVAKWVPHDIDRLEDD